MNTENIKIRPAWAKSRDEIWDETFERLGSEEKTGKTFPVRIWLRACAAAGLLALILTGGLYTESREAARGEHATVYMPDGSTVVLNAGSKLSYRPLAWAFSRKALRLEGEACFEVKPGGAFRVLSGRNTVTVRGTAFNVYARPEMYRVTCLAGRVEVRAGSETFLLGQGMQVTCREGKPAVAENVAPGEAAGWRRQKFVFVETPLAEVVAEMERQYDIRITPSAEGLNHLYTGNFVKTEKPEDVLDIIGRPFGITFNIEK
ncbi:MAG: FecR domain-containing protein [Tannerella sp.]|jgi:ferric-dicitrate binding protein FerR (iron transport regulator)|nr:FecR domain-containing protein [Tannerella sp.]